MKLIISLLFLVCSYTASAYQVFTLKRVDWSKVKTVDVFIAGYGEEMGLQFFYGAVTRAQNHDEWYDDSRAQIILWTKEDNKRKDAAVVRNRGFHLLSSNNEHLYNSEIYSYLSRLNYKISSLQIISHNAAFGGSAIQNSFLRAKERLNADAINWSSLRSKFTDDAFVFLHGCNTGFIIAPEISAKLQRPVFGSLTSTDFQQIFANGQWYHNNAGFGQYPSGMAKSSTSKSLYSQELDCWKGYCHRMMPNEHPYVGTWGNYRTGLPYYQAFCNYGSGNDASCRKGIKEGIKTTVSVGSNSWEDKVIDFMCPRMADPSVHENCISALKGTSEESFFRRGGMTSCTRKKCSYRIESGISYKGGRVQNFVGSDAGLSQPRKDFEFFMSL